MQTYTEAEEQCQGQADQKAVYPLQAVRRLLAGAWCHDMTQLAIVHVMACTKQTVTCILLRLVASLI